MSGNLATVSYIGATILFILSLGGLSNPETSRRGNLYGIIGMSLAVLATVFGPRVSMAGIPWIVGAMVVGGSIGVFAARTVQMTGDADFAAEIAFLAKNLKWDVEEDLSKVMGDAAAHPPPRGNSGCLMGICLNAPRPHPVLSTDKRPVPSTA